MENLHELNEFLENIREEKYSLEAKIEELEHQLDYKNWEWIKPSIIEKDDYRKGLPLPRLEINIWGNKHLRGWTTGVIYPEYGRKDIVFSPLDRTTTSGDILNEENPSLPWKGEFHLYAYSRIFNIPMYLTRDSDKYIKELEIHPDHISSIDNFAKEFNLI